MPYTVRRHSGCPKSKPYAVVKVDGGRKFGCHSTRRSASRQIGAIESSEKEAKKNMNEITTSENTGYVTTANADDLVIEKKSMHVGPPMTSFDEYESYEDALEFLQESKELIVVFEQLANNVVEYVPREQIGGKLTELANQFSTRVKNLFSGENSSSNDEDEGDMETESKDKEFSGMYVWKDQNGQYKWIARYSNNFRDRDYPPEIISGDSHKNFVKMVDEGLAELPFLQIWHEKSWTIGKADWVAYDEIDGIVFALAGGHFFDHAKSIAEKMSNVPVIGVSHGMPVPEIERDSNDKSVIVRHITTEISPLPPDVAANRIADFHVFSKEANSSMTIPEHKRSRIASEWGIDPDQLDQLEASNALDASKGLETDIEHKEANQVEEQDANVVEETAEEIVSEMQEEVNPDAETQETPVPTFDMEEFGKAIGALIKEAVDPLVNRIAVLENKLEEKQVAPDPEVAPKQIQLTPTASMVSIARSVIGLPETRVDGRTSLAKDKPVETEAPDYGASSPMSRTIKSILSEHGG